MQGARRDRSGTRVSRFVFTLNNWTPQEYNYLINDFAPGVKWMCIGKETGENGTPHLQGACILGTRMAFSKLKTLPGFKRSHIESMRGKPEDSLTYCSKEDSSPFVCGELPSPGKRTDVAEAVGRIQAGERLKDLAGDESGGIAIVKFHKGLTVLRSLTRPRRTEAPKIFWLWGPTGVGKTRAAIACSEALSQLRDGPQDDYWISSGGLRWFDGYDGQTVAILDDFRAKHVNSFAFFLRLLDRYDMDVEFKGGFVKWSPSYIFITCPYSPESCFRKRGEHIPEDIEQLMRRISQHGGCVYELERELYGYEQRIAGDAESKLFIESVLERCGYGGVPTCATNPDEGAAGGGMDVGGNPHPDQSLNAGGDVLDKP